MKRMMFFTLVLFVLAASPVIAQTFDCTTVTDIPFEECEALVAIYDSTNGSSWTYNTNWLSTNTPSDWFGVTVGDVNGQDHVLALHLPNNGLNGSIPTEVGNLTEMEVWDFEDNTDISGVIPQTIGNIINLEILRLDYLPNLGGSIPISIGDLDSLWHCSIAGTGVSGTIPPEFQYCDNLRVLNLISNDLSGTVPVELANILTLEELNLSHNPNLVGNIPPQLGNLHNLETLGFAYTGMNGSIPVSFSNLVNLISFKINEASFSGPIPTNFINLSNLITFYYDDTDICEPQSLQTWLSPFDPVHRTFLSCLTAVDDVAFTLPNTSVDIAVLANDNLQCGPVTITSISSPTSGTAVLSALGIEYTPSTGYLGLDSFQYGIINNCGDASSASVMVTVNTPPVALDDYETGPENNPLTIDVLNNDSDADGHSLQIVSVSDPGVTFTTSTVTFPAQAKGVYSSVYTISDGLQTASATAVAIMVGSAGCSNVQVCTITGGNPDNFDTSEGPEQSNPDPAFLTHLQNSANPVDLHYDVMHVNEVFGETLTCWPSNKTILDAYFIAHVKASNSSAPGNDGIGIWDTIGNTWAWYRGMENMPGANGHWQTGDEMTLVLNLGDLPVSSQGVTNVLPFLQSNNHFAFQLQDDSGIDYAKLVVVYCDYAEDPAACLLSTIDTTTGDVMVNYMNTTDSAIIDSTQIIHTPDIGSVAFDPTTRKLNDDWEYITVWGVNESDSHSKIYAKYSYDNATSWDTTPVVIVGNEDPFDTAINIKPVLSDDGTKLMFYSNGEGAPSWYLLDDFENGSPIRLDDICDATNVAFSRVSSASRTLVESIVYSPVNEAEGYLKVILRQDDGSSIIYEIKSVNEGIIEPITLEDNVKSIESGDDILFTDGVKMYKGSQLRVVYDPQAGEDVVVMDISEDCPDVPGEIVREVKDTCNRPYAQTENPTDIITDNCNGDNDFDEDDTLTGNPYYRFVMTPSTINHTFTGEGDCSVTDMLIVQNLGTGNAILENIGLSLSEALDGISLDQILIESLLPVEKDTVWLSIEGCGWDYGEYDFDVIASVVVDENLSLTDETVVTISYPQPEGIRFLFNPSGGEISCTAEIEVRIRNDFDETKIIKGVDASVQYDPAVYSNPIIADNLTHPQWTVSDIDPDFDTTGDQYGIRFSKGTINGPGITLQPGESYLLYTLTFTVQPEVAEETTQLFFGPDQFVSAIDGNHQELAIITNIGSYTILPAAEGRLLLHTSAMPACYDSNGNGPCDFITIEYRPIQTDPNPDLRFTVTPIRVEPNIFEIPLDIPPGEYYIWIDHFNHLTTITCDPFTLGSCVEQHLNGQDFVRRLEQCAHRSTRNLEDYILIPGDTNGDEIVNMFDFARFAQNNGTTDENIGWNPGADFNNNGAINIVDFGLFVQGNGQTGYTDPVTRSTALTTDKKNTTKAINRDANSILFKIVPVNNELVPGDNLTADIILMGEIVLWGLDAYLTYDPAIFDSLVVVDNLNNDRFGWQLDQVTVYEDYLQYSKGTYSGPGLEADGETVMYQVTLAVRPDAPVGTTAISFGPESFITALDSEFQALDIAVENAIITVTETHVGNEFEEVDELPVAFTLDQNYPNPFNPMTTITYQLPQAGHTTLAIYNLVGQRVCTLVDANESAGFKRVLWDGMNDRGQTVGSGIYLYQISCDGKFTDQKRMILMK